MKKQSNIDLSYPKLFTESDSKSNNEGLKYDEGKPRYSLLPPKALREVVKVLTFGSTKYADFNWMKVQDWEDRFFSASQRHQWDYMDGVKFDEENKCHHLAAAITNLMFILELELREKEQENVSVNIKNTLKSKYLEDSD